MIITPMLGICLAALLSFLIGLEREFFAKAAGMRTYTLVGLGSAVFTVVSKYGFIDVAFSDYARFDGSRVAAQIVTGIGFLGAGLIFIRKTSVHGLTTAAGIWFVAAVGMGCGAGLYLISLAVTALYMVVMFGLRPIAKRMPHAHATVTVVNIKYQDGRGILRTIMETISELALKVSDLEVKDAITDGDTKILEVQIQLEGPTGSIDDVADQLTNICGVYAITCS
jgi:putative Mg2+ transporter-C (MgtC) family protein